MDSEKFYAELSDIFEEPITSKTNFKSCETWSSVTSLSVIVAIEELTGIRLTASDLIKAATAGDLYSLVTQNK